MAPAPARSAALASPAPRPARGRYTTPSKAADQLEQHHPAEFRRHCPAVARLPGVLGPNSHVPALPGFGAPSITSIMPLPPCGPCTHNIAPRWNGCSARSRGRRACAAQPSSWRSVGCAASNAVNSSPVAIGQLGVGVTVGCSVGLGVGATVGLGVGAAVGANVGATVGATSRRVCGR